MGQYHTYDISSSKISSCSQLTLLVQSQSRPHVRLLAAARIPVLVPAADNPAEAYTLPSPDGPCHTHLGAAVVEGGADHNQTEAERSLEVAAPVVGVEQVVVEKVVVALTSMTSCPLADAHREMAHHPHRADLASLLVRLDRYV